MNKGDIVECLENVGQAYSNKANSKLGSFTKGKQYKVKAGFGDGDISRSDGRIGAFIINPRQMCLEDDAGNIRLISCDHRFKLVLGVPTKYTRVPVTHLYIPSRLGR